MGAAFQDNNLDAAMSRLFEPLALGALTLENRIVIAPMCQYSADDGDMSDWHVMHLGALALSGAGLLVVEATAVSPEARITAQDVGLWSDANEAATARVLKTLRTYSAMPIAVQLAHAGRKASSHIPWETGQQVAPGQPNGWQTVAPSPVPYAPHELAPSDLDEAGIDKIVADFTTAAVRSARLGYEGIEIHAAHGYLLHQFLSPLSNHRTDSYGGSLENRMRLPLRIFDAVREAYPAERPVWIRVSASDWVEGGWDVESTIQLSRELEKRGAAAIHVSSGGNSPAQKIALGPSYQVHFAQAVKDAVSIPVIAVGLITEPEQAEDILQKGQADAIGVARTILFEPHWPWRAAAALGGQVRAPAQYFRSQPREFKDLFKDAAFGQR